MDISLLLLVSLGWFLCPWPQWLLCIIYRLSPRNQNQLNRSAVRLSFDQSETLHYHQDWRLKEILKTMKQETLIVIDWIANCFQWSTRFQHWLQYHYYQLQLLLINSLLLMYPTRIDWLILIHSHRHKHS